MLLCLISTVLDTSFLGLGELILSYVTSIYCFSSNAGDCEMVQQLLAKGAYVDPLAVECGTPLHIASKERQAGTMKILLDHNADVSLTSCYFWWNFISFSCYIMFLFGSFMLFWLFCCCVKNLNEVSTWLTNFYSIVSSSNVC